MALAGSRRLLVDPEHARYTYVSLQNKQTWTRRRRTAPPSVGSWRRRRRPTPCTPGLGPQTNDDRSRRSGPVRQGKPDDSVVAGSSAPEVAAAAINRPQPLEI